MTCPRCAAANVPDAPWCSQCFAPLAAPPAGALPADAVAPPSGGRRTPLTAAAAIALTLVVVAGFVFATHKPSDAAPLPTGDPLAAVHSHRDSVVQVGGRGCDDGLAVGTGFVVGDDLVVTNAHVVAGMDVQVFPLAPGALRA